MQPTQYIVVFGDPVTGFTFDGPFDTIDLAHRYIDRSDSDRTAWVAPLNPDTDEYEE